MADGGVVQASRKHVDIGGVGNCPVGAKTHAGVVAGERSSFLLCFDVPQSHDARRLRLRICAAGDRQNRGILSEDRSIDLCWMRSEYAHGGPLAQWLARTNPTYLSICRVRRAVNRAKVV